MSVTKAVIPAAGLGTRFLLRRRQRRRRCCRSSTSRRSSTSSRSPCAPVSTTCSSSRGATRWPSRTTSTATGSSRPPSRPRATSTACAGASRPTSARCTSSARVSRSAGHAVLVAKEHVGNNPFAVLLGDDLIDSHDHLLEEMVRVREEKGGSVIALMEVPEESVHLYGCAAVEPVEGDVVRVTGLVEKPTLPRRRATSRSSAATSWTRRSSRCSSTPSRAAATRSS